jgi:protein-disulfide isomerase
MLGSSAPGPPETTGQPIARDETRPRASGQLLAMVAIALGFVVLLGGVGAVALLALRTRPGPPALASQSSAPQAAAVPLPADPFGAGPTDAAPPPALPLASEASPPGPQAPRPAIVDPAEANASIQVTAAQSIAGTTSADVTLSVFGDLTCPHTRRTLRELEQLRARLGERLRLVFYHRTVGGEAAVRLAGDVALTALREGPSAGWSALIRTAITYGADLPDAPSRTPLENERVEAALLDDQRLAAVLDVRMTPTLFVNGTRLAGEPDEGELESAIQREQRAVGWLRAQGVVPQRAYALRVRKNLIEVEDGAPDRACVPRGEAPELGPDDALVTLVEFTGFDCNACRELEAAIGSVIGRHPKEVRRLFRGLAPERPARARRVAAFALSAQSALGDPAFWSLYRALRAAPLALDDAGLLSVAKQVGLDGERLLELSSDETNERRLNQDLELADALNVPSVPALFVNGRLLTKELTAKKLEAVVTEELAIARRITRAGTPVSRFDELLCRTK